MEKETEKVMRLVNEKEYNSTLQEFTEYMTIGGRKTVKIALKNIALKTHNNFSKRNKQYVLNTNNLKELSEVEKSRRSGKTLRKSSKKVKMEAKKAKRIQNFPIIWNTKSSKDLIKRLKIKSELKASLRKMSA